jgi:hypothetical protein
MSAVAENQPANKHRMNKELSNFAARLRGTISNSESISDQLFNSLALELFALQFKHNSAYKKICEARKFTPQTIEHWTRIPFVPTSAFKELELTSFAPDERVAIFHSSGTTEQKPSRHFHNAESLELYEASLWKWFERNCGLRIADCGLVILTPPPFQAPHSSLIHMFEAVRQKFNAPESSFVGKITADGSWILDFDALLTTLNSEAASRKPQLILGTAFSFVHLFDYLAEGDLRFNLPAGSHVMETGGYKNRSRSMPKEELHALITWRLGVPCENIICEYGMSELSSQAYAGADGKFKFTPWACAQIISPETGREVADGETGLIRVLDLANVFSVAAIQTEDLAIRRGDGFELVGRAQSAEPRGCSLMTA